ncbi:MULTISPECIES: PTS transporter subunit EIIC [Cryobacterium]|uniref:PTS glucose transporter subunit IIB n=1 Tax=Cryobacterium zongtaii TaxID=1259217 RepID=A0A2S3ZDU1_9MICO|nr:MULTISPECIES: PTS transporter subunit EIIC [Cryobacterium]POH64362.1 PTS glucose transporter subunit IIB [Cryobacterium zongtaii]POH67840.1 PTS glucose transporter subunit IIB [Cryobacterium zongtaii]TFC47842.1 PTS glucose transporter subunit IIB [Cryobacterium sp. TMN-39-2]
MFKQFQKIGKAFMLPIAILPAAGLLLGIGGALSNPNTVQAFPALDNTILQGIFGVMSAAGSTIFTNLALLLSIGLCIGLAKRDKGTAALAGIVGYLVMTATITAMLDIFKPDAEPVDTGVVGALVIGATAVFLHNRYRNIELPAVLGFFGGSRFVPIVTAFAAIFVGIFFFLTWPPIQQGMLSAGTWMAGLGPVGTFFYGFGMRLSGAVGLHHMIYPLFWYTPLGGTELVNGTMVEGAQKIFFAQLADPNHVGLYTEGTRYFSGRFATMMFGLPAACLAMWHCIPKGRRAKYTGLFLSVALTSFITGITEPIEFMFLFVAPLLYVFHAFLDGVSFFLADILDIRLGNTFSGGAIDFTLFGILQGNDQTNWLLVLPIGAVWFALYYFSFRFAIKRFKIGTPGHLEDTIGVAEPETQDESALVPVTVGGRGESTIEKEAAQILQALGGATNLEEVDACITRLRVSVKDPSKVDKPALRKLGATDVFEVRGGVQAVYGGKAILYKSAINESLGLDD